MDGEAGDRVDRVEIASTKRVDIVGDLGEASIDPAGSLEQVVAVRPQLVARAEGTPPTPTEDRAHRGDPTLPALAPTNLFSQRRNDREQVADHEQVGEFADGRVGIAVDRDDVLGGLHARPDAGSRR